METGRAPFKLLSFLVLLIILSWFSEFELYNVKIKNNSPPAVVSLGFFTVWNRRQRRVRLVIAKSTKHGLLALCLPETPCIASFSCREFVLLCGDVHPHPGPVSQTECKGKKTMEINMSVSVVAPRRIAYSTNQLISFGKNQHSFSISHDLELHFMQLGCARMSAIPSLKNSRRIEGKCSSFRPRRANFQNCILVAPSCNANYQNVYPPNVCTEAIPIRMTDRKQYKRGNSPVSFSNRVLIPIECHNTNNNIQHQQSKLPSFYLSNARSIFPKLDELSAILATTPVDVVAITESWLYDQIDDSLVSIDGFNIFRKDRVLGRGGGVCVYLREGIPAKRRYDLEKPDIECLWLWIRPTRLPRPLSGIAVCVVYHPPGRTAQEHQYLKQYLIDTLDSLRNKYPDCGLVVMGDFNDFDVAGLLSNHSLKQVVQEPTRGTAKLDLIITNLHNLYDSPVVTTPLGASDHNSVRWKPQSIQATNQQAAIIRKRQVRRYPKSSIDAFGRWATSQVWFKDLGPNPTVEEQATSFTSHLVAAIDNHFPLKTVRYVQSDKPWITPSIKLLIKERQKAFHCGDTQLWRSLKTKLQKEIVARKKHFYRDKVQHLKKDDCRKWWSVVNAMSGRSRKDRQFSLQRDGVPLTQQ
jgi:hypothetical protein